MTVPNNTNIKRELLFIVAMLDGIAELAKYKQHLE
jgi:hypothetical protein